MEEVLIPKGTLKAHTGFVTAIAVPNSDTTTLVTSSRDKSLILWRLTTPDPFLSSYTFSDSSVSCGYPYRRFTGHSHFIQDVVLSSDSHFALSASWDTELRLWDLTQPPTKSTTRRFIGHEKDVLSVTFSPDNRHILSGSRDRTMKLWNTLGDCKFTFSEGFGSHTDWVSSVRFSPSPAKSIVVSGSWDKTVKVWDLNGCKLVKTLNGHTGCVSFVTISPDGSMCASGGKDGVVWLWDLGEGKALYDLKSADGFSGGRADAAGGGLGIVHGLCFCPVKYWLAAATEKGVMIWDLEKETLIQQLGPDSHDATAVAVDPKDETKASRFQPPTPPLRKNQGLRCTSVNWSSDGNTLYTGYTDGIIRVWEVAPPKTADYYG